MVFCQIEIISVFSEATCVKWPFLTSSWLLKAVKKGKLENWNRTEAFPERISTSYYEPKRFNWEHLNTEYIYRNKQCPFYSLVIYLPFFFSSKTYFVSFRIDNVYQFKSFSRNFREVKIIGFRLWKVQKKKETSFWNCEEV